MKADESQIGSPTARKHQVSVGVVSSADVIESDKSRFQHFSKFEVENLQISNLLICLNQNEG